MHLSQKGRCAFFSVVTVQLLEGLAELEEDEKPGDGDTFR